MKKTILLLIIISIVFVYLVYKNSSTKINYSVPPVTQKDHLQGTSSAQLVLVEYSDLECPYCINFHKTMQQVMKNYSNKVAWVFRHYPLTIHVNAQKEAEAAECAADLGGNKAFWKYIDAIYSQTQGGGTGFALEKLTPLAKEMGLDETKFKLCLDSGKYSQKVIEEMNQGAKAGIQGTPSTFILTKDGRQDLINGALPYEQVKAKIDSLIK